MQNGLFSHVWKLLSWSFAVPLFINHQEIYFHRGITVLLQFVYRELEWDSEEREKGLLHR